MIISRRLFYVALAVPFLHMSVLIAGCGGQTSSSTPKTPEEGIHSILIASTDSLGAQGTGGNSDTPAISADGRFVTFESAADNLVPGDSNDAMDIFVKDTKTGNINRASTDAAGAQATGGNSHKPSISADGRYVVFSSYANSLLPGDSNNFADVFIKDTQSGNITRVSTDAAGVQATGGGNEAPSISADGHFVTFSSYANNLVAGDNNNVPDIFVKDTQTGGIIRVSTDALGGQGNNSSEAPAISAEGRYLAFESAADNLVPGDTNEKADIFVKDTQNGSITRVSTSKEGTQGNGGSASPAISADGRYVAFASGAGNLLPGDINRFYDIFVKDTRTGDVTLISADRLGNQGKNGSDMPSISADGRYVSFFSYSDNLVGGDANEKADIFVKDSQTGSIILVSTNPVGTGQSDGDSKSSAICANGLCLAFGSGADSLVPDDTNAVNDIFIVFTDGPPGA